MLFYYIVGVFMIYFRIFAGHIKCHRICRQGIFINPGI